MTLLSKIVFAQRVRLCIHFLIHLKNLVPIGAGLDFYFLFAVGGLPLRGVAYITLIRGGAPPYFVSSADGYPHPPYPPPPGREDFSCCALRALFVGLRPTPPLIYFERRFKLLPQFK